MNKGREYHLWYCGAVTFQYNNLASEHGIPPAKNGVKAESSCTIKLNVVDTAEFIVPFRLH